MELLGPDQCTLPFYFRSFQMSSRFVVMTNLLQVFFMLPSNPLHTTVSWATSRHVHMHRGKFCVPTLTNRARLCSQRSYWHMLHSAIQLMEAMIRNPLNPHVGELPNPNLLRWYCVPGFAFWVCSGSCVLLKPATQQSSSVRELQLQLLLFLMGWHTSIRYGLTA